MLPIFTTVLLILIGLPIAVLLCLRLFPAPLLSFAEGRVRRALDVENYNRSSPYAGAGFLPVRTEILHAAITVSGSIPADLNGVYLRNGTNTQFAHTNSRLHMFNGAGMLHQVQIADGAATYSNTYIRTPRFKVEDQSGKELYGQFGDLAGGGKAGLAKIIIDKLKMRFGLLADLGVIENGSSTTAVQYHHGKLYCLQETGLPFALDINMQNGKLMLDGNGAWDNFGGKLNNPFTAHPKIDPASGDWYTYSTDLLTGRIRYAILRQGQLEKNCLLAVAKPALSFLHDYYLTEHYSVFPDLSLRFDSKGLMSEMKSPFYFDPNYKMRFGVIKRDHQEGDAIQWFTTELPGHIWHTINGWEETRADGGTDIVLYAPVFRAYPATVPIHTPLEPHANLHVFRLNLDTGEVTEQRQLLEHFYERPSYNTEYVGRKTRFAYLLDEQRSGGIMGKGVMKYDLLEERDVKYFDYGDYLGGEALFVPKRNAQHEDEGYLLDILMADNAAYLVIVDAQTMTEVAKLHLPQRVPYGVHACWLNEQQLQGLQLKSSH